MSHAVNRILVFVVTILCLAGLATAQAAPIAIPFPQIQTFGMVGLTEGQTVRLNALNPGAPSPLATGAICSGQLSFLNDQGVVLKTAAVNVLPGKSVFLDLDRDTDLAVADRRVEIRATIQIPIVTPVVNPPWPATCTLIPTLEVFNNDTGRTQVVIVETRFFPSPVPLPGPAPLPANP
jgi:hypothetical protein